MDNKKTDLLIIGAGPGGYVSAIYAAKKGLNVTLVDAKWVGGTCLNVGCIPTKALVKSAELYQEILHSEHNGIFLENPSINLGIIIDKKDEVKEKLVTGVAFLLEKYGVTVIHGFAKFLNDKEVSVNDDIYTAKNIIIATGSKTKHLNFPGNDLAIDSEVLLNNKELPKTLAIIGGGVIGMEFAFIYASFGVAVTVIEFLPRVLPGVDKEFSSRLMRFAKQLNITILNNAGVTEIKEENGLKTVMFTQKDKEKVVQADMVLEAVGRVPMIDNLGLENTKILHDFRSGVSVDSHMLTNVANIYAIGDVTNIIQLAHVASHQGLVAVDNILGKDREMNYDAIPAVIFTTPTIATVGKTEAMCKEEEIDYEVVKVPYTANGKALIMEAEAGYMKLLRDTSSKKLIGAMIFGKDADNLIATVTLAITKGLSAEDLQETVFAHPTVQELVHEAAMGLDQFGIHFLN
ncbi:MAG: dihydrolipoyl dehydrogenase [Tenericutes bacterium]|nr:dihydrolipoyl dehydrogenase [Mycoplasmatota bacterium]